MSPKDSSVIRDDRPERITVASRIANLTNALIEAVVLVMVCASPWALGSVGAEFEFYLFAATAILLGLWTVRMIFQWHIAWQTCPIAICLAGYILLGVAQLTPMPSDTLNQVSPGTTSLYAKLIPKEQEVLPSGESLVSSTSPVAATLSLYPDATRRMLLYLLAIFTFYSVVRNNVATTGALRRLCIGVLINGAALSLFGVVQFFSTSEAGTVYWVIPTPGTPFGPFVNRNHFAFYINLCIGLSIGLLLWRGHVTRVNDIMVDIPIGTRMSGTLRELLHDPAALWIAGGGALMLSSVVFCLSRGGFLALICAATVASTFLLTVRGANNWRVCATMFSIAIAMGLLIWFGLERVEERLSTLWSGTAIKDPRVFLLANAWPAIETFPILGTGLGTFQFVEPIYLHEAYDVGTLYEHAHNDYLESLIEGGAVGLCLRLLLIATVYFLIYRAIKLHAGAPTVGFVVGLAFAFTSLVVHSFFEFGLYVPAIVVLATVICAHISGLADSANWSLIGDDDSDTGEMPSGRRWRLSMIFPPIGAAAAIVIGFYLYSEGLKVKTLDTLRVQARVLRRAAFEGVGDRAAEIPNLETAIRLSPHDAQRRFLLAEAHFDLYTQSIERADGQSDDLASEHLVQALKNVVTARNLGPVLPTPHARIAFYTDKFGRADSRSTYIDRVKFLAPADPQLWYLCGLQELSDEEADEAWKSWRHSLELSERFLLRIVDRAAISLTADEIIDRVLPDDPATLLAAARVLFPQPESSTQRLPFVRRASQYYDNQWQSSDPQQWHTKAIVHVELGEFDKAIQAYQAAVAIDPKQVNWRFEFAKLLHQEGRLQQARQELVVVLSQRRNHTQSRQLLDQVAAEVAAGSKTPTSP